MAYTKFIDPNTNRLIRLHLGRDSEATDPVLLTLLESYRGLTPRQWVDGRIANLSALTGAPHGHRVIKQLALGVRDARQQTPLEDSDLWNVYPAKLRYDLISLGTVLRVDQRDYVFKTLGLFNVAWPLLLILCLPNLRRRLGSEIGALLAVTALTIVVFIILELPAGAVVVQHAPYGMIAGFSSVPR